MEREAMGQLESWKRSARRKPLVVRGARQVGKTWLVREFAQRDFDAMAHVVFLDNEAMKRVFSGSLDPERLLSAIGAYTGTNPLNGKTLVFLDEIQECPRAITALKMFCEQTPDVPIVAAGSLLGLALNRDSGEDSTNERVSWPVGKVDYLDLHPMTFREFLRAMGQEQLADLIDFDNFAITDALEERYNDFLRRYLYIGGMPEAVQAYVDSGLLGDARAVQARLLLDYEHDFSKHVESAIETEHIREVWRSAPTQIARETGNNKFLYSQVKHGGRGREYRNAISWLVDAGLVTKVHRVTRPGIPLRSYEDEGAFKLYLLDVGLLGAALHLNAKTILEGSELFTHAKGVYAEQYVCQQLVASSSDPTSALAGGPEYWSADGKNAKGEVDFLYECEGTVVPVEVKAGNNVKGKSIARFSEQFGINKCVRFSLRDYSDHGWIVNVPLYAANLLPFVPGDEKSKGALM